MRKRATNVRKWGMKLVTPLLFMFARKQALSDFNKTREAYNAQLQRGKEMGLDEPLDEAA